MSKPHIILRAAAALTEALDIIGAEGKTDHDLARIICDNEVDLAELARFAAHAAADNFKLRDLT